MWRWCVADEDADGICDDVDDCVGAPTSAASATVLAPSTSADVLTSLKATATATETSSTRLACAVGTAADADLTASVTTSTTVSVRTTPSVCNGACLADLDGDGVCDDSEPWVR